MINPSFWRGKRVYLTGHTGFKGSWLAIWLNKLGAIVKGYSLESPTNPNLYSIANLDELVESEMGDICNLNQLKASIKSFLPDIVIHLAAQSLVRYSYVEPIETFSVNAIGTANLLEACRNCQSIKAIVAITTDKCYENNENGLAFRENEPMGGHDPYSSSKGCAELIISSYRRSFFDLNEIGLASARAGNVIGGGDWADQRLIPDTLRAFEKNEPVVIRNPNSIRPWQHVLEPLNGYLMLAERIFENPMKFSEAWNFGPEQEGDREVSWILNKMIEEWERQSWTSFNEENKLHEASYLKLDISKAKKLLGWKPIWSLEYSITRIVNWHKAWLNGENMLIHCEDEIEHFMSTNINYEKRR